MWKYASLESMEVTHSPACTEVLIVSGVSILNDSVFKKVFKVLRSRIGLHRLLGLGTKNSLDFLPVLLHFCSPADTVPLKGWPVLLGCGSCLWQLVTWSSLVWTGRGGCSPLSEWWLLLDSHQSLPTSPNTFVTLPLQVDLWQQVGHLWQDLQNSSDLHKKHLSHILFLCTFDKNWDLCLSFVATRWQYEHLQHKSLHSNLKSLSCPRLRMVVSSLSDR